MNPEHIKSLAASLSDEIRTIRHTLHANPELSFREFKTAAYIEEVLDRWYIGHERVAETGVTGVIEGSGPGKYLVLRADTDALPIQEQNDCSYRSQVPGVMHACGHDVHTACLLGAVRILALTAGEWAGRVRFVFQPGEEMLPGGARKVLESGLLDEPRPDLIFAQHVYPEMPAGRFGFREGQYMASTDEVFIEVNGIGGHGALPHRTVDPVLIASHIVVALQQVVSRKLPAHIPAVLSFGKFEALGSTNVIPHVARLEGTFRTMDEAWRNVAHEEIRRISEGIAISMGATAECRIVQGYPSLYNEPLFTRLLSSLAVDFAGDRGVEELPPRMTGEDFSLYALQLPAVFYRLGTGSEKFHHPVHHPEFDIDESALEHGTGMMAWLAVGFLMNL